MTAVPPPPARSASQRRRLAETGAAPEAATPPLQLAADLMATAGKLEDEAQAAGRLDEARLNGEAGATAAAAIRVRQLAPQWDALAAELETTRNQLRALGEQYGNRVDELDAAVGTRDLFRERLSDAQAALDDAGYGGAPTDSGVRALAAERDQLRAENQPMREALQLIADPETRREGDPSDEEVARAALGGAADA